MVLYKPLNDLGSAYSLFKTLFAVAQKQRKQDAGLFHAIERQRQEQAVVKLKLDCDVRLKSLDLGCGILRHTSIRLLSSRFGEPPRKLCRLETRRTVLVSVLVDANLTEISR